jgi:hypothetical protein
MSAQDLDFATDQQVNPVIKTLNPLNGATLTSVPTATFFGALGIGPNGVLYGGTGDQSQLFTINPITGATTLVGSTGRNFVGDLAAQPVPEPGTLSLLALGLTARWMRRRRHSVS